MSNFIVIEKDSLSKSTVNSANITLTEASIVHTKMHRDDVAEFIRDGNNLVLKLKNGEVVVIENFFIQYDEVASDLVFEEDNCALYWFDGVSGFQGIPGLEALLPAVEGSKLIGLLPWIVGGGLVAGGIIAATDDDKTKEPPFTPEPVQPEPPVVTIDPVDPIVDPKEGDTTDLTGTITVPEGSVPGEVTVTVPGLPPFTAEIDPTPNPDGSYNWKVPNVPVDGLPEGNTPIDVVGTAKDPKDPDNVSEPSEPVEGNIPVEITPVLSEDDNTSMKEDTIISGNVLANDKQGLTVTSIQINGTTYVVGTDIDIPNVGTVNIASDGEYSFTPVTDYSGDVPEITYTVSDGTQTDTANLNIEVTAVADQPAIGKFEFTPPPLNLNIQTWSGVKNINGHNLLKNDGDGADKDDLLGAIDFLRDPNNQDIKNDDGSPITSNESGTTNDLTSDNLPTFDAVYISGYIYLEAGQTYLYAGSGDDSAAIVIGDGVSSLHVNWEGTSTSGNGEFTVGQSGFYSFQFYAHNADGEGNYDFMVQNKDGTPPIFYPNVDAIKESLKDTSYVLGEYNEGDDGSDDTGFYPVNMGYQGNSDASIDLTGIDLKATDTDGSEYLSFVISGLPEGATLTFKDAAGKEHTIIVGSNGKASYTPVDKDAGTTAYSDFKLTVGDKTKDLLDVTLDVTSTEKSNGDSSSSTLKFEVKVEDAETPVVSYETESLIKTDAPTDKVTEQGLSAKENPWELTSNSNINYWANFKDNTSMGIRQDSAGVMEIGLRSGAIATDSLVNGSKIAMQLAWNNGFQSESGQGESTVFKLMVNGVVYATVTTPSNNDGSPVDKTGQALIHYENGASGNVASFNAPTYEKDGGDPSVKPFEWNNWEIYLPGIPGDASISLHWDVKQSTVSGDGTSDDLFVKDLGVYPVTTETTQLMSMSTDDNSIIFDLLNDDNLGGNTLTTVNDFSIADQIDISSLLSDDATTNNLAEFVTVEYDAENDQAVISIDRDGTGTDYESQNLVVLLNQPNKVELDDLINNNQIIY